MRTPRSCGITSKTRVTVSSESSSQSSSTYSIASWRLQSSTCTSSGSYSTRAIICVYFLRFVLDQSNHLHVLPQVRPRPEQSCECTASGSYSTRAIIYMYFLRYVLDQSNHLRVLPQVRTPLEQSSTCTSSGSYSTRAIICLYFLRYVLHSSNHLHVLPEVRALPTYKAMMYFSCGCQCNIP